ncbi:hypothetical protein [Thermomonas sp.]|uniref:hypothetical protein n=1 Tax=Thermomonas sp. TaxID=1971895 RepID=UPI0035B22E7D
MEPTKRKRNWWIPAFFAMAIAFEGAREVAVVASNEPMAGSGLNFFWIPDAGYATAEGQWVRSDGGSPIIPNSIAIRCEMAPTPRCIEASTNAFGSGRIVHTNIDVFEDVKFTADGITYTNDNPDCATYSVRLDGKQKRVTATRVAKAGTTACLNIEPRVVMELQDGLRARINGDWMDDHFLPIVKILRAL